MAEKLLDTVDKNLDFLNKLFGEKESRNIEDKEYHTLEEIPEVYLSEISHLVETGILKEPFSITKKQIESYVILVKHNFL
jgi:hypothetical protein